MQGGMHITVICKGGMHITVICKGGMHIKFRKKLKVEIEAGDEKNMKI